ncbi:MAG: ATP-binding protein, partial [Pseudomonadota bacterium]
MFESTIDQLTLADIESLVEQTTPEGRSLEFKRDLYGGSDKDKKEAAADISAMANGSGGTLIIGIAEKNGAAHELVGVKSSNPDDLILKIEGSLRSSLEPILQGVRIKWIPMSETRGVLVIGIPRSWAGPHRVIASKDRNFYIRDENGKHPMTVEELRRAFTAGPDLQRSIENFREERLAMITNDEGPLAVKPGFPILVVHIVPYIAFRERYNVDLTDVLLAPMGASGWSDFRSLDGKVSYSGPEEDFAEVRAYSTVFRNGCIEAVG